MSNSIIDIEQIKLDIIKKLEPLHPAKIILFRSCTYSTPNKNTALYNIRKKV